MSAPNVPPEVPASHVYAGDAWRYDELHFEDGDTSDPFDLTDGFGDWKAQFRPTGGSAAFVDLTVDDSRASDGVIVVSADGAATRRMGGDGEWDLQALDGSGQPVTFIRSRIRWMQDVTR